MNKITSIVIGVVIIIVAAVGFLLLRDSNTQESSSSNQTTNTSASAGTESNESNNSTPNSESYVVYSEADFASTSGQRILFFHADWCPQCKALEADILRSDIVSDVTIFEVDYDTNQDLRQKYGVTLQTTLVSVNENGELITKYVAYDEPTWDNVKNNLL